MGARHRSLQIALNYLEEKPWPHPSIDELVQIVRKCTKERNLDYSIRLHAYIQESGLETHRLLGDNLVSMFIQSGSMRNAQNIFEKLNAKNEKTWNSLITGYIASGDLKRALSLYKKMKEDGLMPDAHTFVALLKACAKLKDLEKGHELHDDISSCGLLGCDIFVGSTIIYMYVKCSSLAKAHTVLEELPVRNVVSWNALISGYVNHGYNYEAMDCLELMTLEGISPNAVSFTSCLKACANVGAVEKGREFHDEINRKNLLKEDALLAAVLVDMYGKLGMLSQAQEVFDNLSVRSVTSWNALIAGYVKCGHARNALQFFQKMKLDGVSPDAITFASTIKACGDMHAIEVGSEIHEEIERAGLLGKDLVLDSALVDMYAKCGMLGKARKLFDKLEVRDVISWTSLIAGYVEQDCCEEALECFDRMKLDGVSPDAVTFACSLKACGNIGAVHKGNELHNEIRRKGLLGKHLNVDNALLDMYTKFALLDKAQEVFDNILFRDIVSWNTLITGYAKHDRGHEVLKYFEKMKLSGLEPDSITYTCCLKACGCIGAIEKGRELHGEIEGAGLLETNLALCNSLVDMYAKCGSPTKAQEVFDKIPSPDLVTWNALIAAYAQVGDAGGVFGIFEKMKLDGVKADSATFTCLLNACNHGGLVENAQKYFEIMTENYCIVPSTEQHTCVVDLLGRAGQLDKAIEMMFKLPFHPDVAMWCTVLGACRKWGNVAIGKQAFEHAVRIDEKDAELYVCMSNIYADANMHEDARKIEELRVRKQAWKKPGHAWWSNADNQHDADKVEEVENKKKEWKMLLLN